MSTETRVKFTAPQYAGDLRLVLTTQSASDHDKHQVSYSTQYGETRVLRWLTKSDAHSRAQLLKRRGYTVAVSNMGI